ncbi:hypothetical protein BDR04DRAFT_1095666 [Suillus decipiens]|nr:hypothetical protein BDR04DRAFT_1095666 [Suillus decipiens]
MQTALSVPNNTPLAMAQHAEVPASTDDTPLSIVNRASKLQHVRGSPINALPEEIILHIFKLGVSCRNSQKRIDFAVLASHVCSSWRNIAFSCSSLWADITITTDNMHHVDGELPIKNASLLRAKEFALRSGVFPLSVRLKLFRTPNSVYIQQDADMIMNWLCQVLPRVKYLSVRCDTLQVARLVMEYLHATPMRTLETYKMKYGPTVLCFRQSLLPPPPIRFLFLAGQNEEQPAVDFLPKLTRVEVSGFPVPWSQWSLTRLTSLSINFMTMHDRPSIGLLKYILTINRETLEKFEIQGAIQQYEIPPGTDDLPTKLPRLTDLTLGYLSQWEAITFFLHFEAPALKHLRLCDISRPILAHYWPQDFKDGFNLSNPSLHNMRALQPFEKFSSTTLLEILAFEWASTLTIETLTLEHLIVRLPSSDRFLEINHPSKQFHDTSVALVYHMLKTCSRLRRLALINPEDCFIHALSMYPDGADADDTENSGPTPMLTHLYLASLCPERLLLFLKQRTENLAMERGPHVLDYLELATEPQDLGYLLRTIVSNHIDMNRLAKSSLVARWQGSFST